jgi:plastocyanin
MSKRWFSFIPTAALALVVLAACGGEQAAEEDATRVPDAANAPAAQATEPAEEAGGTDEPTQAAGAATAAAIATGAATPMGAQTVAGGAATPVAGAMATPMAGGMATPMAEGMATPMAGAMATPMTAAATPAAGGETAAAPAAPAAQALTVTSFDIYFEPAELTIPADQDVVVALPNQGASPHNFAIDELGISVDQPAGATDLSTTINAPAGEYEYYCNVPGHKQAGMVGTLTVE